MAENPEDIVKAESEESELCPCGSGLPYSRCCGA